jgi:hypothetical protein
VGSGAFCLGYLAPVAAPSSAAAPPVIVQIIVVPRREKTKRGKVIEHEKI